MQRLQNITIPCCWSSSWADPESTSKCASNRPAGTEFGKMTYEKPLSNFPSTRSVCTGSLVTGLSVVTIDSIEAILLLDTESDLSGSCCSWRPWCLTKWCLFPYMLNEFTTLHILAIHARRAINRLITLVLLTRWLDYQTKVNGAWKEARDRNWEGPNLRILSICVILRISITLQGKTGLLIFDLIFEGSCTFHSVFNFKTVVLIINGPKAEGRTKVCNYSVRCSVFGVRAYYFLYWPI